MRLRDLAAQHQADAGPTRLGCKKRHEQVGRVRQAVAFIPNIE